jgi:uncharacterized protein YraI
MNMKFRSLITAGIFAAGLAVPAVAEAAIAHAVSAVNLRSGPSTSFNAKIVIPPGARLTVYSCSSWCKVSYGGLTGWVSASYLDTMGPPVMRNFPHRPMYGKGYARNPWWDNRHQAWYDGSHWWVNGRWSNKPGAYFSFGFRG